VVFVSKKKNVSPEEREVDLTVASATGRRVKTGQVGIEVEVEGRNIPKAEIGSYWNYHRDNSLRGADNGEFVLAKPIDFNKVGEAVDQLWAKFASNNTRLDESTRTSVHVHLNVLPFFQNRLTNLMALWFIFEEVFSFYCGEHRAGNLFCIRAKDGPAIITQLKKYVEAKGDWRLNSDSMHYAALNVSAIQDLGSIEIRTMKGVTEPEPIKRWVGILKRLYDLSAEITDPRTIVENFSMMGALDFFRDVLGDDAEHVRDTCGLTEEEIVHSLHEGMRFANELVHARDWSEFNPKEVREDPFGRKTKTVKIPRVREQAEEDAAWADLNTGGERMFGVDFARFARQRTTRRLTTEEALGRRIDRPEMPE